MSAAVLRGFYKAHGAALKTIPIRNAGKVAAKYQEELKQYVAEHSRLTSFGGREKLTFMKLRSVIVDEESWKDIDALDKDILQDFDVTNFKIETLGDLCLAGIAFRSFAGVAAVDLLEELKEVTSHNIMIAVDHWNHWEVPTAFYWREKPVIGKELCIPNVLQFFSHKKETAEKWNLKNGIVIAATSLRHNQGGAHKVTYDGSESSVPLVIRVPHYDGTEFASACAYYQQGTNVIERNVTTQDLLGYRTMTGSLPAKIREDLADYWVITQVSCFLFYLVVMHRSYLMSLCTGF
jgi:hypothetical protein